jgi:DNA-binding MarR family transcriptional regulator
VTTPAEDRDRLDDLLEVWAREIPDLDPLTEGIVERIQFLAKKFNQSMDRTLEAYGLEHRSFQLLGKLRSVGPPYQRTPGELADAMHLSGGAMTNRLDRAEEAGLVRRLPDPNDRRGTLIEPTAEGHRAWDTTVGAQAKAEARIASSLTDADRELLHALLRRLMRAFPPKENWAARTPAAESSADPVPEEVALTRS